LRKRIIFDVFSIKFLIYVLSKRVQLNQISQNTLSRHL